MAPSSSSSSSSPTWVYDVFPSFSGEDVRVNFLSHFLKELDRKLIRSFRDNEIERSRSLDPELREAIKDSRIAVVVFSKNYASSSWCLNELLEIMKCKEKFGQMVIPVFYGLDPSHVRKQTGDFGRIFEETCHNKTEEVKFRWREALTNVANILRYHSVTWGNEAKMIEEIANDLLDKLLLTPSKDSEYFVGIEDHIANMSVLLQLESEEVRMVGLWGSSGIGKTTIARTLFNRLSRHFQGSIFIDRVFLSKSMELYNRANADDYNMKLHLQGNILSEILGKRHIEINHLSAVGERLKHQKVLIFIDDLDDQVVLDALVGQTQWFGSGSRIFVVTNDKHFLRAHGIDHIYEVCLPSEDLALEMLCQYAFRKKSPPEGFENLVVEVARHVGSLPLGLNVLGSSLRGRDKEYWMDMMLRLHNGVDGKIEKTLRVIYNGLSSEDDKAIFRHIACLFNGAEVTDIKLLLANSNLDVNIGLKNLADKSLIQVISGRVEMHRLLQEMGRKIVRTQSIVTYIELLLARLLPLGNTTNTVEMHCLVQEMVKEIVHAQSNKPGKREYLMDSKDVCNILRGCTGTEKVIGISLDLDEVDKVRIDENAFERMSNLRFLKFYKKSLELKKEVRWVLPKKKLKLLSLPGYPMKCMPSNFCPEYLVEHRMPNSNLKKLWKGIEPLTCLKDMDLLQSKNLKKIPDLSTATNLETLDLHYCSRLVELYSELSSSIQNLNKLTDLNKAGCTKLEAFPNANLESLILTGCSQLKVFPDISSNRVKLKGCGMRLSDDYHKHGKVSESSTMVTYERHMSQHQVFINFWGEEVRFSLISHLVYALSTKGVNVFIEKYEKRSEDRGKNFQSIEDSNIALVVFSSRYTESRWCLDELVKIKERMDEGKLLIIPIFYKVEPSQVKQLEGDFGLKLWNLWRIHRDHRIIKWKDALEFVSARMGFCLKDHSSESEFITVIAEKILSSISLLEGENPSFLPSSGRVKTTNLSTGKEQKHGSFLKKCPFVGLEQRMKQLEHKLEFDCNETRIIGVVGMAGIGNTTLAMMLHDKWNCKFVRCVPLLGIRKMSVDYRPAWLRKTLLEVLLGGKFRVINDKTTHESLKEKLLETKVFVVLDDVSNKKQLKFLLGDLKWIKKGSKIVITSCDKSLIEGFVHDTYAVPSLNYGEALQLFSYHAFGDHVLHPTGTSMKLWRELVDCTGGNPLVIKLLGKQFHGRDEAQWEMRQEDLTHLGIVILNIFRFSCDELSEKQKDVFLDIACFFRSVDDYFARSLLDSGDHDAIGGESEVRDLTHKGMIAISGCRVEMHDLLYMFGKIFSSQALIEENGGKSRLWFTQEIIDALINQKDTKRIRGIFLDMSEVTMGMMLDRLTFINMPNLRYLKIYDSCCSRPCKALCVLHFPDGLELPLENIRYLHWVKYPLEELPQDFRPEKLVDLRLTYSRIERVWEGVKDTPRLKWVDLSHSSKLLNLSGLTKAESLQRLNLEGCTNLEELPGEMQNMKSLVYLNMRGCIRLRSLPKMNLISLETLILSDCSNLKEFQVISKSLEVLHLDGTAIKGLPLSIENLQRLVLFNMKNCKMLECLPNCLGQLKVLDELILSGCTRLKNLLDVRQSMNHVQILLLDEIGAKEMPKISCFTGSKGQASVDMLLQPSGSYPSEWPRGFDGVSSLRRLCLSGNDFASLQNDIGKLYNLTWLDVKQCKKLRSVPMLPPRLQYFDAHGCDSLEKVANPLAFLELTEQAHAIFNFSNCEKLDRDAQDSIISYTRQRSQLMLGALSRSNGNFALEALIGTCFPGWEVPEWFSHRGSGSVLEPKLPPHWCDNRFTGIALCAVVLFPGYHDQRNRLLVNCNCEFKNKDRSSIHFSCTVGGWSELSNTTQKKATSHVFIGYTSMLDISKHGGYDEEGCFCTKSSIVYQVTDGTEKVVGCEILQCGFSLVYATDESENVFWDAKTVVIPKWVKNVLDEEKSYGNSGRDDNDNILYQSYSRPTLRRDEYFLSERKSDARENLRKSFGRKRFNIFKNAGGEITISSNHHNTPSQNVEKPSLVGVEPRLKQLEKLLFSTPGETRIVGVVGMPGIGKTTLANILFEKRGCKFPHNLFLTVSKEYIPEESKRMFLEDLLEHITQNISEETTNESVKDNPLQTKFFVVLDNVRDKKQLEFLLGNLNWIKKGSKIVVTACDKSLVEGLAHDNYVVPHLNNREAFQVFIYHAFDGKIGIPGKTFLSLSRIFVENSGGNPLALKLLGSELHGKDEAYWEHKLQTVSQNSNMKIQNAWRFYIDQLTERQKDVFLDIACFFRSEDEYFIMSILDSGDPDSIDAVSEVRDLAEKFLITISDSRVEMNDQLYTFSKGLGSPGWLRLWKYRDILDKLRKMKNLEANNVRGIFLDMSKVMQSIAMERKTFINMCNLRYLKIYETSCPRKSKYGCKLQFPDGFDFPLEEVRYFHWLKFPLEELPPDFRPKNLVDLRLPYSNVERLWKGVKDTPRLKWVDLSHSSKLLNLSGLAKAESLQRLNLEGCTNLEELPGELQNMKSLVYLNMRGCIRLRSLRKMNLISLETLILSDCSNLEEFQVISKSLEVLHLDGTAIKELPLAIQKLQRLVLLNLKNCKLLECLPNCLSKLKILEELILSGCSRLENLPDVRHSMKHVQILLFDGTGVDEMPNISCFIGSESQVSVGMSLQHFGSYCSPSEWPRNVNRVSSMRRLCLSGHNFVSLHNDIRQLYNLTWLDVKQCKKLRSIPMLPPRLQYFDAHGCDSLERVAYPLAVQTLTEQIHATFNFSNCNKLDHDATDAIISYTRWKSQLILDALSRYNGGFTMEASIGTCFPGWDVPAWFSHRSSGSLLEPKLPPHWCDNRFTGIALCAVIIFPCYQIQRNRLYVKCNCELKTDDGSRIRFSCTVGGWSDPGNTIESSHVFIGYASKLDIRKIGEDNEEGCMHTEASFKFQVTDGTKELEGCEVMKCGFSLVYASDNLQVNSREDVVTVKANKDISSSSWVQDFFGYIFLAFSCGVVSAILSFSVSVFAPKYYLSFSGFCRPLVARILFFVAFGLFLKQATRGN